VRDLNQLRDQIEAIDQKIVSLVADRLDLCREVGRRKMVDGIPVHLPDRVLLVTARWVGLAADRRVDPDLVRRICELVIAEGLKLQQEEMLPTRSE
jgi:chorismate mutase